MSRKEKTYVVNSMSMMPLTLAEISNKCGIKKSVLYDRIHRYNWDIERAINTPVRKKSTNKVSNAKNINNNLLINSYINSIKDFKFNFDSSPFISLVENMFNKNKIAFSKPDYIGYKNGKPCIIKGINCDNNLFVSPWTSHPHRYPIGFFQFIPLISYAKSLGGVLYLINYAEQGDEKRKNEIRILEISDYYKDKVAEYIQTNTNYIEYLDITDDLKLTREQFKDWMEKFNLENQEIKHAVYDKYKNNMKVASNGDNRPAYWKDPIPQVDHVDNKYNSIHSMCKAYNINPETFRGRIKRGWTLEKALTTSTKRT